VTIAEPTLETDAADAFEKKALARLGGSICFVSKRRPSATATAAPADVERRIAGQLREATFDRIAATSLANAEANRAKIGASVRELADRPLGDDDAAVVIAAGPSLQRRRSLERLREAGFRGTVVAVDGALGACLRAGVVPHVVVTADPHAERIVCWFGDPALTAPAAGAPAGLPDLRRVLWRRARHAAELPGGRVPPTPAEAIARLGTAGLADFRVDAERRRAYVDQFVGFDDPRSSARALDVIEARGR
jgi:Protein of unknown function DUF115